MSNRDLSSGWITTGSDDSGNTQLVYDFGDSFDITNIFLVEMNFKNYTVDYWTGVAWVNLETITSNESTTIGYEVNISTNKIRITITATVVADDEKKCLQIIITKLIGQFRDWPVISDTEHTLNKQTNKVLSGKFVVNESIGAFSCSLAVNGWTNQDDISLIESIIYARRGVIIYINAGIEDNFKFSLRGYRAQDFYVVKPINEYSNDLYKGLYQNRPLIDIELAEVAA